MYDAEVEDETTASQQELQAAAAARNAYNAYVENTIQPNKDLKESL